MSAPPEKGRLVFWLLLTVIMTGVGFALGLFVEQLRATDVSDRPPAADQTPSNKVPGLGRIAPEDGVITIGVATPDRIEKILVKEGEPVEAGKQLVRLDSEKMRRLDYKLVKAQWEEARERKKLVEKSGDAQIKKLAMGQQQARKVRPFEEDAQKKKVEFLNKQEANAREDLDRMRKAGGFSLQDEEKQKLLIEQTVAEKIAAQALLDKMTAASKDSDVLDELEMKAAKADLEAKTSAIPVDTLELQMEQAEQRLDDSILRAPSKGTILRVLVHDGELVSAQPILRMADTSKMVVTAEIYETEIHRVRKDQRATITSPVFKKGENELEGTVESVSRSIDRAQLIELDPRAAVDKRVFEVKIRLDDPKKVERMIGHQVRVEIDVSR